MPDLKQTRSRLMGIAAGLVVVDLVCVVMLLTPVAGSERLRQEEISQLLTALKSRERAPWLGIDKKIPEAKKEIAGFYHDRLPDTYSAISTDLDKIGAESGVRVGGERYKEKDAGIEGLQQVEISTDVAGDYLQLMKFINALERSRLFFIVNSMQLGSEQSGAVRLQITLETYLRTT